MKNAYLIVILLIVITLGCNKDDHCSPDSVLSYVEQYKAENDVKRRVTCEESPFLYGNTCEVIPSGTFTLVPSSIESIPQFCKSVDHKIIYKNKRGEKTKFVIDQKLVAYTQKVYNIFSSTCDNNPDHYIAYCINSEIISYTLVNEDNKILFEIDLFTALETPLHLDSDLTTKDVLTIRSRLPDKYNFQSLLYHTIDWRDTPKRSNSFVEYEDTISIAGQSFDAVYTSYYNTSTTNIFQVYYNHDQGLVGYIDTEGVEWALEE